MRLSLLSTLPSVTLNVMRTVARSRSRGSDVAPPVRPRAAVVADLRASAPPALRPLYDIPPVASELYEAIADCPMCGLARTRTQTVPGSGPLPCALMFIGEGPGQREDELGLPFVGRSGQFLDDLLASIGRSRESVYVPNVVKCRPPGNRDPDPTAIAACAKYLDQQIKRISVL